ncbi:MAG TPA: trypsin-like peptidase domain-containing protein [Streptosporangiaceae bacterium]|nr:trypsin-like peptidase domain-containing protein [Streptosporangiaceae bacterium]
MRWKASRGLARAAWITTPLSFVLALAATVWLAAPAAPATASLSALDTPVSFSGTPAVGALFTTSGGQLGKHFCTASVVNSPAGDLILTAAHCMKGHQDTGSPGIVFVPGYDDGAAPFGIWQVTRIFTDTPWATTADPDDDFAFLTVARPGRGTAIQSVTGAENLGTGQPTSGPVRVIGYPDGQNQPVVCQNSTSMLSPTQTRFDCDGYTNGTSGSPFLTGARDQTVVGVIGGYQQGGDSPDVSYAAVFGQNMRALYDTAVSRT